MLPASFTNVCKRYAGIFGNVTSQRSIHIKRTPRVKVELLEDVYKLGQKGLSRFVTAGNSMTNIPVISIFMILLFFCNSSRGCRVGCKRFVPFFIVQAFGISVSKAAILGHMRGTLFPQRQAKYVMKRVGVRKDHSKKDDPDSEEMKYLKFKNIVRSFHYFGKKTCLQRSR